MEIQYITNEKEYQHLKQELQEAITSNDIGTKQVCLRRIALHFGMEMVGGMANPESKK